ncbi:hypothetical protein N431DRAFT_76511 [Stipitochalara longipes BDJ]|nr:hypothetical protein N431DRAFT_76511 [Stipitochalara longipes BDJ]
MSSAEVAQGQRLRNNCKIIWGGGEYDLDVDTDHMTYTYCTVKKDVGLLFGGALTMTQMCTSEKQAWRELDRMLEVWAIQAQSGKPMTKAQRLEIFVGANRRSAFIVK